MPIAPTYPGVYIEEIPSGVHTITGVSTSITAFVGYTARGVIDEAVHIFSFADFERAFGGLSIDSPLSYCVSHFFQNGGSEAYVVRTAAGAASASVIMRDASNPRLTATALGAGTWGNAVQIDVDYDTSNPDSLFNITATEYVTQNGRSVPATVEVFRNLSMNPTAPSYAVDTVNATSRLVRLTAAALPAAATFTRGNSVSGA